MSKQKTATPSKKKPVSAAKSSAASAAPRKDGIRETVESVVIAFVLAFLFRTFEAEAFVIPTGSMAPTLLGANKDVVCPECGVEYTVGASRERDEEADKMRAGTLPGNVRDRDVVSGTCPNCRFTIDLDPDTAEGRKHPTYNGDRILVAKFPYQFGDPERWDVPVFKYPETANQNYIKRLVGLPGETIVIYRGDIFTKANDGTQEKAGRQEKEVSLIIQRKPPEKVLAMKQLVYDNDHPSPLQQEVGWPARWQAEVAVSGSWKSEDDGRAFTVDGAAPDEQWLAYRHTPPTTRDWRRIKSAEPLTDAERRAIEPQLIGDFCAYDANEERQRRGRPTDALGMHWVGDLVVECELQIDRPEGQVILRLVKGGRFFDCTVDPANGKATLSIPGFEAFRPTAQTPIVGPGTYRVAFANFDNQLYLWVNRGAFSRGEVTFDSPTTYDDLDNHVPNPEDLAAVRIGSRGAALRVDHLRVSRDIFYVAAKEQWRNRTMIDFQQDGPPVGDGGDQDEEIVKAFLSNPNQWSAFEHMRMREPLVLEDDQFLMLGDNSPQSKDSRLWTGTDEEGKTEYYVKRDLLTGKALFVYWPHSWNKIIGTNIPCPFFPNFSQMRLVR